MPASFPACYQKLVSHAVASVVYENGALHTEFGCIVSESTFGIQAAQLIEGGASRYLFDQLPSLYETVESTRFLMPMK